MPRPSVGCPRAVGFTLVELLVVIAIIGVLVGLLLPAVQSAREAARRNQCSNNMRQLGLGMHNYHDANQHFPPGVIVNNFSAASSHGPASFGWGGLLLPYLEEGTLNDQYTKIPNYPNYNWETATGGGVDAGLLSKTSLKTFECPSDSMPTINTFYNGGKDPFAKSNYVGVAGTTLGNDGINKTPATDGVYWPLITSPTDPLTYHDPQLKGMLYANSKTSFRHVGDGASHTFLIAERDGNRAFHETGRLAGYWAGAIRSRWVNSTLTNIQNDTDGRFLMNAPTFAYGVGSMHPGGCNFVFGDCHVEFVTEGVDGVAWQRLGTMAEGEPLPEYN